MRRAWAAVPFKILNMRDTGKFVGYWVYWVEVKHNEVQGLYGNFDYDAGEVSLLKHHGRAMQRIYRDRNLSSWDGDSRVTYSCNFIGVTEEMLKKMNVICSEYRKSCFASHIPRLLSDLKSKAIDKRRLITKHRNNIVRHQNELDLINEQILHLKGKQK